MRMPDWYSVEVGFSVKPFDWRIRLWRGSGALIVEFGPFALFLNS